MKIKKTELEQIIKEAVEEFLKETDITEINPRTISNVLTQMARGEGEFESGSHKFDRVSDYLSDILPSNEHKGLMRLLDALRWSAEHIRELTLVSRGKSDVFATPIDSSEKKEIAQEIKHEQEVWSRKRDKANIILKPYGIQIGNLRSALRKGSPVQLG